MTMVNGTKYLSLVVYEKHRHTQESIEEKCYGNANHKYTLFHICVYQKYPQFG